MVESTRLQQDLNSGFHSATLICNIQVKGTLLVIWKLESVRHTCKHFVQKQEIFIANKISIVDKDEEKAELFKCSHATIKTPSYFYSVTKNLTNCRGRPSSKS